MQETTHILLSGTPEGESPTLGWADKEMPSGTPPDSYVLRAARSFLDQQLSLLLPKACQAATFYLASYFVHSTSDTLPCALPEFPSNGRLSTPSFCKLGFPQAP